jgi:hypothetical protein
VRRVIDQDDDGQPGTPAPAAPSPDAV